MEYLLRCGRDSFVDSTMTFNTHKQSVAWHKIIVSETAESTSSSVPGAGTVNSGRDHSVLDTSSSCEKEKKRNRAKFITPNKCGEREVEDQEEEPFDGAIGLGVNTVHDMAKYYDSDSCDDDNKENENPWEDKKRRKDGKEMKKYKGLLKSDFENVMKKIGEGGKIISKVRIHADILKPLLASGIVKKVGWKNDVEKARKFKAVILEEMKSLQETGTFTQERLL